MLRCRPIASGEKSPVCPHPEESSCTQGVTQTFVLCCETNGCEEALGSPAGLCHPSVPERYKDLKPSISPSHLSETLLPESLLLLSDFPEKPFHLSSALFQ